MNIWFIRIIRYDRSIFTDGFLYICHIATILFSGFSSKGSFRIGWILQQGRVPQLIGFADPPPFSFLYDGLFCKASYEQFILRNLFETTLGVLWSSFFVTLLAKKIPLFIQLFLPHEALHNYCNYADAHNYIQHMQIPLPLDKVTAPF